MGYLVYCPTCNGKMSNNAYSCPHCGETKFEDRVVRLCTCSSCEGIGKKKRWKDSVYVRYGAIDGTPGICVEGRVSFGCVMGDNANERVIRGYIDRGDYVIYNRMNPKQMEACDTPVACYNNQVVGRCNAKLAYGAYYVDCEECNGTGKVKRYVIADIRKRVL